jgi:transposase
MFCRANDCQRAIFTERLPFLALPYARRTKRLAEEQRQLALYQGGEAAARMVHRQGMPAAGKTLLRFVRRALLPGFETPRCLGVDDWALRKGRKYGTILVDLERHRPIDLLGDRSSATLEQWLREHPGVEIISRDRANDYAEGASRGAPDAIQVADRFHLLKNIREMLERILERNHTSIRRAAQKTNAGIATTILQQTSAVGSGGEPSGVEPVESDCCLQAPSVSQYEQRRQQHRERRFDRYTEVRRLHEDGFGIRAIARQLKMSRESVRRFVGDQFPERAARAPRRSKLAPHVPYLTEQLTAGRSNALQLWRELKSQYGYTGSHGLVSRWVAANRSLCPPKLIGAKSPRGRPPKGSPVAPNPSFPVPSARRASWLLMTDSVELTEDEAAFASHLCDGCSEARTGQLLAKDFTRMVKEKDAPALDAWIERAKGSCIPELINFATVLCRDHAAVSAALTLDISNGQVEGQINRLKLIKRAMYGRANFDLLKRRVLAA